MTSTPSTSRPDLPVSSKEWRFKHTGAPCEWAEEYRPGGFHPVNLGDTFCKGKYKVIRKLGAGSFSTVWLAASESAPSYVALKIMTARSSVQTTELIILDHLYTAANGDTESGHITRLLDHFKHEGPNGIHQCLVFEVMGSTAASLAQELPENKPQMFGKPQRYPKSVAKTMLLHTLRGLAFLHQNGVVHGDVQPGNILFSCKDLESLEPRQLEQNEAKTVIPLHRIDGKLDLWAPKNLYLKQSLHEYVQLDQDFCVKLSDFGAAFFATSPPTKTVTPLALRAPELILKQTFNASIDMWSFGCLIYEFLTDDVLFAVMVIGYDQKDQDDADDEHLCQLNDIIQALPDPLMRVWPRASLWYDADHNPLQPSEDALGHSDGEEAAAKREGIDEDEEDEDKVPYIYETLEQRFAENKHPDIDAEEAHVICQLIREVLVYDPAERATAEQLLKHPWFLE